jgi:hypothetical protein
MSFENLMVDANGKAVIIDWGMVVKTPMTDRGLSVKVRGRETAASNARQTASTASLSSSPDGAGDDGTGR